MLFSNSMLNGFIKNSKWIFKNVQLKLKIKSFTIEIKLQKINNIINIDSGCAMFKLEENSPLKTALSCLCLDTMDEYYLM